MVTDVVDCPQLEMEDRWRKDVNDILLVIFIKERLIDNIVMIGLLLFRRSSSLEPPVMASEDSQSVELA